MHYSEIKTFDIADGLGVRTTLFVSGCRNHCEGCFQPETWNFENGPVFDEAVWEEIFASMVPDYIQGLTLLGGDPFEEENQRDLLPFMREFKKRFPDVEDARGGKHASKNVWALPDICLMIFCRAAGNIQNTRMNCYLTLTFWWTGRSFRN